MDQAVCVWKEAIGEDNINRTLMHEILKIN